jgi:ubiquinone biosynthesis protein
MKSLLPRIDIMAEIPQNRNVFFKKMRDTVGALSSYTYKAMRHGLLPSGGRALGVWAREGAQDLHLKTLGDSLVAFFREAGPVLTKFGQILATRNDLLPRVVCSRLERLYSGQPPMSAAELKAAFKRAYASKNPFSEWNSIPLAVGSIGQVHRGRLKNGDAVVIKVLRPGVARLIERDLNAAKLFIKALFRLPAFRAHMDSAFYLERAIEDLGRGLLRETDLRIEAESLERFRKRFEGHAKVYVPRCYAEYSSKDVLVMEELRGESLAQLRERAKHDPAAGKRVADLALREILRQIFEDGHFHADPHGGNLLILDDGRLGLIDLGLTGELSDADRKKISRAIRAFLARDADALIATLLEFGELPPDFDIAIFKKDISKAVKGHKKSLVTRAAGKSGSETQGLESFVNELFRVARTHQIHVPSDATLLIKTLVTIEGVARSLDPELNLAAAALPVILKSLSKRWLKLPKFW